MKAASNYKWANTATVIVSAGIGIYNTVEGYQKDGGQFGYNAQIAAASSTGSIVGGWAGAQAGATLGLSVGAWFGPAGLIVGPIVGGLVGGFGGSYYGGQMGTDAVDLYYGR